MDFDEVEKQIEEKARTQERKSIIIKMIEQCYLAVVNHKRKCIPPTIEGKIVRDADKISYIGKNRWKRCIEEEPEALDEIIEVYLPILREEVLRLDVQENYLIEI